MISNRKRAVEPDSYRVPRPTQDKLSKQHMDACLALTQGDYTAIRANWLLVSALFGTTSPSQTLMDVAKQRQPTNDYGAVFAAAAEQVNGYSEAFTITFGVDKEEVSPELKKGIKKFLSDSYIAYMSWGLIAWTVKVIKKRDSNGKVMVTHRIPEVMLETEFDIKQKVVGCSRILYAIQPSEDQIARINITDTAEDVALAQTAEYRSGIGTDEIEVFERAGFDCTHAKWRHLMGVYVITQPKRDGYVVSAAASVLTLSDQLGAYSRDSRTASAIMSAPHLVIQPVHSSNSSAGSKGRGGESMLDSADPHRTRHDIARKKMNQDSLYARQEEARIAYNHMRQMDDERRSMERNKQTTETRYSSSSATMETVETEPAFESRKYSVAQGYQVAHQVLPHFNPALPDSRNALAVAISRAWNVPLTLIDGESSKITASVEVNDDMFNAGIVRLGEILAEAAEDIINCIYQQSDADDLNMELLRLRQERDIKYSIAVEHEEQEDYSIFEHAVKELDEMIGKVEADLLLESKRYSIVFTKKSPTSEQADKAKEDGIINRRMHALLKGTALGIPVEAIDLQEFPNPFKEPENESANPRAGSSKTARK